MLTLQFGLQAVERHPVFGQVRVGLFGPAERVGQGQARTGAFEQAGEFADGTFGQAFEVADAGVLQQFGGLVVDADQSLQAVTPLGGAIVLPQQVLDGLEAAGVTGNAVGVVVDRGFAVGHVVFAAEDAAFPALHGLFAVGDDGHAARQFGFGVLEGVETAVVADFLGAQLVATGSDFLLPLVEGQAHAVEVGPPLLDGLFDAGEVVGALFDTACLLQQFGVTAGQRGLQVGHLLFAQAQGGLAMAHFGLLGVQGGFLLGQCLGLGLGLPAPVEVINGEFDGPAKQQTQDKPTQCVHARKPPAPCCARGTGSVERMSEWGSTHTGHDGRLHRGFRGRPGRGVCGASKQQSCARRHAAKATDRPRMAAERPAGGFPGVSAPRNPGG